MKNHKELQELIDVVKALRDPKNGCPWDLKQTHNSLLKYLIEESYEYIHATESLDYEHMEEELGDVLLQVLLHSTIAEQENNFTLESVSKKLKEKLIRRHPHVFENNQTNIDVSDVVTNWEKIKAEEKNSSYKNSKSAHSLIDESYLSFPALFSSDKIGKKTAKINFDWDNYEQVFSKVKEELEEFRVELKDNPKSKKTEEEYGDLLFSMAQLGRHLGFSPEESLRSANKKFLTRFKKMENLIKEDQKHLENMNQTQMDFYWDKVKKNEKSK